MLEEDLQRGSPIGPLDWHGILPFRTDAASDLLGWVGLQAARCRAEPAFERRVPALTHHRLVYVARPPDKLELRFDGVKRKGPSPPGSITLVPANDRLSPMVFDADQVTVFGRVVTVMRRL